MDEEGGSRKDDMTQPSVNTEENMNNDKKFGYASFRFLRRYCLPGRMNVHVDNPRGADVLNFYRIIIEKQLSNSCSHWSENAELPHKMRKYDLSPIDFDFLLRLKHQCRAIQEVLAS
uniref:DUF1086 domain-containing protein n=1 Tax=Ascaris lumbricoides TaxID=6252 RepID=A0A0M3IW29_ASCLU